jgi:hypothetical protein
MSSDLLREAAALMRSRAKSGTLAEPWTAKVLSDGRAWVCGSNDYALSMHGYREDAEHIASWHPAVALAVADVLDCAAFMIHADRAPVFERTALAQKALAVARAYLPLREGPDHG